MQQPTDDATGVGSRLGDDGNDPVHTPSDALRDAAERISELKEYVSYYISAKTDGIKATVRSIALYAALGLAALVAALTFIVVASALLVMGIAHAFARLFNGHVGAAYVVTSVIFLAVIFGGAFLGIQILAKASRKRTEQKYEHRKQQQRARFGTDVQQQARNAHK